MTFQILKAVCGRKDILLKFLSFFTDEVLLHEEKNISLESENDLHVVCRDDEWSMAYSWQVTCFSTGHCRPLVSVLQLVNQQEWRAELAIKQLCT